MPGQAGSIKVCRGIREYLWRMKIKFHSPSNNLLSAVVIILIEILNPIHSENNHQNY